MRFHKSVGYGIMVAALTLAGCGSKDVGKYRKGSDDPALKVTEADLAQAEKVLAAQDEKDRAAGLSDEPSAPRAGAIHQGATMPPGHPPVGGSAANAPADRQTHTGPAAGAPAAGKVGGGKIVFGGYHATLPAGWSSVPPSSTMRLAELRIAPAAGDPEPGEVTVFYFGPGQGGTVQMNLDRWYGQMQQPDGSDSKGAGTTESFKAAGMEVTLISVPGIFAPNAMPGQAAQAPKENWRMLAAIVTTPDGPYFFKGTGPDATMLQNRDAMITLLESIHPAH